MVAVILDNLAEGMASEAIVAQYQPLVADDVAAPMKLCRTLAREEALVPLRCVCRRL